MKVRAIRKRFRRGRIVAVQPRLAPVVDADWRRRLNLYTGRTLSHSALATEQIGRGGRLAVHGQSRSPGTVFGLEMALDAPSGSDGASGALRISAGLGLAPSGEDVVVPQELRVRMRDLAVYAPSALLDPPQGGEVSGIPESGALLVRRLGPTLDALINTEGLTLPPAGIVLLQPIVTEMIGTPDPHDPCEQDPRNNPFDDQQLADGFRLVLYAWPTEWLSLPDRGPQWRNRIAYAIFRRERQSAPEELLPWEQIGVPLGVVGFDDAWVPLFLDRYAVVRAGGRPKCRAPLAADSGNPYLWSARIQQFQEQVAASTEEQILSGGTDQPFRFLPPTGLLPKGALDMPGKLQRFFPATYHVDALPIPMEQLDGATGASASLAPFDMAVSDRVELLVPVPQIWYEPRLLMQEAVDQEFQETLNGFLAERAVWLQRREDVRRKETALVRAMTGEPPEYPDPDPDALEKETIATDPLDPPEDDYGTRSREGEGGNPVSDEAGNPVLEVTLVEELRTFLDGATPLREDEVAELDARGLEKFIDFLEAKVKRADDKIDFGFLRVQTEMYRIRQLVLGNEIGTRLATSPALAGIARGDNSFATREQLSAFQEALKRQVPPGPPPAAALASSGEPSGPDDAAGAPRAETGAGGGARAATGFGTTFFDVTRGSVGGVNPSLDPAVLLRMAAEGTAAPQTRETGGSQFFLFQSGSQATPKEAVIEQNPLVGKAYINRNVTVTERLADPSSNNAKSAGAAVMFESVRGIGELDMALDDIEVGGVPVLGADNLPTFDPGGRPQKQSVPFSELRANNFELADRIKNYPDPSEREETVFFDTAVSILEETIGFFRRIEGRTEAYRAAVARCRRTLADLRAMGSHVSARLKVMADSLAEARHDVAVARALLAEEQARIDGINQRRSEIIEQQIKFLAFRRPRLVDTRLDAPVRSLDPGEIEPSVPVCLARQVEPPAELQDMIELLREAPVRWFTRVPRLFDRLDRIDLIQRLVLTTKQRARSIFAVKQVSSSKSELSTPLAQGLSRTLVAQHQVVQRYRAAAAQFDPGLLFGQTWRESRDRAEEIVSLGDLIDGSHRRTFVAEAAARELRNFSSVAACLYARFGEVLPSLRLNWAQRLSEHDTPIDLRNLSSLPRWGEIEYVDRRDIQSLVDWLYKGINGRHPEALAMIHDLIRVCLLLASHAPVSQIIAGHVPKPTVAVVGGRVDLAVDLTRVRIGMQVLMYGGNAPVARGVVEDLGNGQAGVRVVKAVTQSVALEQNAKVHFGEVEGLERHPLTRGLLF